MPNHVHGTIWVMEYPNRRCDLDVEPPHGAALHEKRLTPKVENKLEETNFYKVISNKSHQYIPKSINKFKGVVTKFCTQNNFNFRWEDRYYDVIMRNERQLAAIEDYIKNNPENWNQDVFNLNRDQ